MDLLSILKSKLRITWDEDDSSLLDLIESGKAYLENLTNRTFDFENEKYPKALLLEYCRYDFHNVLDQFEKNFAGQLKRLILYASIGRVGQKNEED